jgi:hypothetical protein
MSFLYDSGRNLFLTGGVNWMLDNIRIAMVKNTYTANQFTHTVTGDIGANFSAYTNVPVTGKSASAGVADGDDINFSTGATNGESINALVIWKGGATPATSQLIAYIDSATGFPLTTNGAPIDIIFDNGANKIFKL